MQSTPATISIFHWAKVPTSARVYASLEKAYFKLNDDKNLFQIDLMAKQMPTYDQFKTIYSQCVHGDVCKDVLKTVFPLLNDKLSNSSENRVTFKALGMDHERGFRVFSQNEYEKLHKAYTDLVGQNEPDIDPTLLFKAPLLIDWDQNMIACDEDGLEAMLEKYRKELKNSGLTTA